MSQSVAEGAVGEEEVIDAGLGKYVSEFRGGATVLGARGGASGRAELATEFKSSKKARQVGSTLEGSVFQAS